MTWSTLAVVFKYHSSHTTKLSNTRYVNPSDSRMRFRPVLAFYNPITNVFTDDQMTQYRRKVKKLMCLSDVSTMLNTYAFKTPDDFADATKLVFQNCLSFGKPIEEETSRQNVLVLSREYLKFFDKEYKAIRGKFVVYDEAKRKKRERVDSTSSDRHQVERVIKVKKKKRKDLPPGIFFFVSHTHI